MRPVIKILLACILIAVVAIALSAPAWPRIAIGLFARTHNLDLTYAGLKKASLNEIDFRSLTVTDRKRGIGIYAEDAVIRPLWNGPDPRNATIEFDLRNVRFVKKAPEAAASYNNLDGLVALPFSSSMTYPEISGKVHSGSEGITVRDFLARSADIKLSFSGKLSKDNKVSSDIVIYFADSLTRKVPEEMTKLVLNKEDGGWKSLSVKLEGDFSAPRIEVSSRLFRLQISAKE